MSNNRKTYAFSMDAPECKACKEYDSCKNKRRVACLYMEPALSLATNGAMQSMVQPVLAAHEYRNVKIGESTTVTIDLCEVKKKIVDEFYKELNCRFLGYGG